MFVIGIKSDRRQRFDLSKLILYAIVIRVMSTIITGFCSTYNLKRFCNPKLSADQIAVTKFTTKENYKN